MKFVPIAGAILALGSSVFANGSFGPLNMAWVASYSPGAVGYQNGYLPWNALMEQDAPTFVSSLSGALKARNPSGDYSTFSHTGSALSAASFAADGYNNELTLFHTHGDLQGALAEWAQTSATDKRQNIMWFNPYGPGSPSRLLTFGGWNRWVFFLSCLSMQTADPRTPKWADSQMKGVHALFGFESASYSFDNSYTYYTGPWYCPNCHAHTGNADYQSWRLFEKFTASWVNGGQTIWAAYRDAVVATQYNMGGSGTDPAAIYRYGYLYGQYGTPRLFDGSAETVDNVYNGAVLAYPGDKNWPPNASQPSEVLVPVSGVGTYLKVHYAVGNPDYSGTYYGYWLI